MAACDAAYCSFELFVGGPNLIEILLVARQGRHSLEKDGQLFVECD